MAVSKRALQTRAKMREFALGFPGAHEDFPWGETVIKVNKKVFVFLGKDDNDGEHPVGMSVKLAESHEQALAIPSIEPTGYGLGKAGWVSVPFDTAAPPIGVLRDWVEESYRLVALKRLVKELDARNGV